MKLEVGQFVRTEYGISKIVNIFFEKTGTFIETDNGLGNCNMSTRGKLHKGIYILEEDYKSFIDNNVKNTIIDLIKVGDVLVDKEGHKYPINYEFETDYNSEYGSYEITIDDNITLFFKDGLSIATKEQFGSMSYKVGE